MLCLLCHAAKNGSFSCKQTIIPNCSDTATIMMRANEEEEEEKKGKNVILAMFVSTMELFLYGALETSYNKFT